MTYHVQVDQPWLMMKKPEDELQAQLTEDSDSTIVIVGFRTCPKCGLECRPETTVCPNDGTSLVEPAERDPDLCAKYEFLAVLGQGGMSIVYRGRHKMMHSDVAIKLMRETLVTSQHVGRFQQEAQGASRLKHPNIVTIHDFGVAASGQPFIVMEYAAGKNLGDIIKEQGKLTPERAVDMFVAITAPLAYAHSQGVVHRDLKPSNIMVETKADGTDEVKLVDFGIAKFMFETGSDSGRNLTRTGEVFGSPPYMSPEQCSGAKSDVRSDIYSLGCMMFEALCGEPPFTGANLIETMFKHINSVPPSVVSIAGKTFLTEQLERIINRCLAKKPQDRYQSCDDLRADLEGLRIGKPVKQAFAKTNVVLPFVVMFSLMIAGATAGWFYMNQSAPPSPQAPRAAQHSLEDDTWFARQLESHSLEKYVDLNGTTISDKSLIALANEKFVHGVYLEDVPVTDRGIAALASLPVLEDLNVNHTGMTDAGLQSLSKATMLRQLSCEYTQLSAVGVDALTNLKLESLNLHGTGLHDDAVKSLTKITTLRRLDIGSTEVGDDSIAELNKLVDLEALNLSSTDITDETLMGLRLPKLNELDVSGDVVTMRGLKALKQFPHLNVLVIRNCPNVSKEDLHELKQLMPHLQIDAGH